MAAFIPGESPPDVNTPIFSIFLLMLKIESAKLANFRQIMNWKSYQLRCSPFNYEVRIPMLSAIVNLGQIHDFKSSKNKKGLICLVPTDQCS